MKRFQVLWAKRKTRGPQKGELLHIGGINGAGEICNIPIDEAIQGINSGSWEFYLVENLQEIPVTICSLDESETFLSSKGHGYLHNLLEELPEFTFA